MKRQQRIRQFHSSGRKLHGNGERHPSNRLPVSSHPEIEDEIQSADGGLDLALLQRDGATPRKPKAIVSVDGRDVQRQHSDDIDKAA